jgi:fumarate reductase subunit C
MKQSNGNYVRSTDKYAWYLKKPRYIPYMLRELSSLFVGLFSCIIVWGLYQLSQGEVAFTAWTQLLWGKFLWLNLLIFAFAFYHSYSWFMVTPKAMPIKFKGKRVPGFVIIGAHMLLWLMASVVVFALFIYGA